MVNTLAQSCEIFVLFDQFLIRHILPITLHNLHCVKYFL